MSSDLQNIKIEKIYDQENRLTKIETVLSQLVEKIDDIKRDLISLNHIPFKMQMIENTVSELGKQYIKFEAYKDSHTEFSAKCKDERQIWREQITQTIYAEISKIKKDYEVKIHEVAQETEKNKLIITKWGGIGIGFSIIASMAAIVLSILKQLKP